MSATAEHRVSISVDDDVELLTEQLHALEQLGQRDENASAASVDEGEVYDLSIRWGTALAGRLPRLVHYSSLGLLVEHDECRFQTLCDQLRAVSDLIDRFGLARPALPSAAKHHDREDKKETKDAGI